MSRDEIRERIIESYKERFGYEPSSEKLLREMTTEVEWHLDETLTHAIGHVLDAQKP